MGGDGGGGARQSPIGQGLAEGDEEMTCTTGIDKHNRKKTGQGEVDAWRSGSHSGREGGSLSLSLCGQRSVGHSLGGRIACSGRINLIGRGWGRRCQAYFWACTDGGFEHGACEERIIRAREIVSSLCDARNMEEKQT